jgi:hypothetical protein
MEDKLILSDEEDLWYFDSPCEDWRELTPEERLLLLAQVVDSVPDVQRTDEVMDAISEAIWETERTLLQPREIKIDERG